MVGGVSAGGSVVVGGYVTLSMEDESGTEEDRVTHQLIRQKLSGGYKRLEGPRWEGGKRCCSLWKASLRGWSETSKGHMSGEGTCQGRAVTQGVEDTGEGSYAGRGGHRGIGTRPHLGLEDIIQEGRGGPSPGGSGGRRS